MQRRAIFVALCSTHNVRRNDMARVTGIFVAVAAAAASLMTLGSNAFAEEGHPHWTYEPRVTERPDDV